MFKFFDNIKNTVANTAKALVGNVVNNISNEEEFSEFVLEDMEDLLISADLGVNYSTELTDKIRENKNIKPSQVKEFLKEEFLHVLQNTDSSKIKYKENQLNIYFITGVNGAGKTTLIGKMAYLFKQEGKKVLVVAGDTFRAAAEEQAEIWSKRSGADIYRKDKADSAAVVYEGIQKAKNENYDVILIDTAGRLQNKFNLMEELSKIKSVINKQAPEALMESILVLDANTGQNGLQQAKVFKECVDLTAVALTKLDGSAKGAIVISIAKDLNLPVKLVGVGEKMEDLKMFNAEEFVTALFN